MSDDELDSLIDWSSDSSEGTHAALLELRRHRAAIPKLLDKVERLEKIRDAYRTIVSEPSSSVPVPKESPDYINGWNAALDLIANLIGKGCS